MIFRNTVYMQAFNNFMLSEGDDEYDAGNAGYLASWLDELASKGEHSELVKMAVVLEQEFNCYEDLFLTKLGDGESFKPHEVADLDVLCSWFKDARATGKWVKESHYGEVIPAGSVDAWDLCNHYPPVREAYILSLNEEQHKAFFDRLYGLVADEKYHCSVSPTLEGTRLKMYKEMLLLKEFKFNQQLNRAESIVNTLLESMKKGNFDQTCGVLLSAHELSEVSALGHEITLLESIYNDLEMRDSEDTDIKTLKAFVGGICLTARKG